jgi:hypothetical protein
VKKGGEGRKGRNGGRGEARGRMQDAGYRTKNEGRMQKI